MSELDKKSIYGSISYFEEIKENNQTNLVKIKKLNLLQEKMLTKKKSF